MEKKVKVTDTTLRDAHQSLWATRMRTEDMLPIADKLDNMGYASLEVWGGATFDVCLRYLKEDPWERLSLLRRYVKKTPLQMLLRGQNLVGYQHYPDDVVEAFVAKSVAHGIRVIRVFDALNDVRNLETAIRAGKREGAHIQAAVVYTISPVHTHEHYMETALQLEQMGADSLCIKDMAGLLMPYEAYELIKLLKGKIKIPIHLHSHYVGGMALVTYLKAIEAGVDGVDTASAALAFGASQPPVETLVRFLKNTPYDTGLKLSELFEVSRYFDRVRKKYGFERAVTRINDMRVFDHQVPGGMISNLVRQLEQQNALDRLLEVLEEIPVVRKELGYPPLVTPTSQIVGTQAVLNVLLGARYKMIPSEVKAYVQGLYGKPPAPIDPKIRQMVIGDEQPITCRPADLLEPRLAKIREELREITQNEEDILSYALFQQVALKFFEFRMKRAHEQELETLVSTHELNGNSLQPAKEEISTDGEEKTVNIREIQELLRIMGETGVSELHWESDTGKLSIRKGSVSGEENDPPSALVKSEGEEKLPGFPEKASTTAQNFGLADSVEIEKLVQITSPMVGTYYSTPSPEAKPFIEVGDVVEVGQTLCIIEAMKLMNEIKAEMPGKIVEILVKNGEPVEYGQPLFIIEKAA